MDRQSGQYASDHAPRLIAGRYRLGSRLGRGGMGVVWRADDELLGRRVAVKELHAAHDGEGAATLREARAVARVKHPHVVVVHDVVVEEDGRPYIVMELVEGGSLADLLSARGPVGPAEAARIGLALLGALRAAHGLGVLHRDLKPANVLLEEGTGRVVLTDFGIARLAGATTITDPGSFVGSPEYTAPERVLDGDVAGPASDLWSLGALLCATLSGESPFHRDSLAGVLHAVVEAEIRPPGAAGPLLPVVRGLLHRDPASRMDAAEAERLLRAYLATATDAWSEPPPESGPPRSQRPRRPRKSWKPGAVPVPHHPADTVAPAAPRSRRRTVLVAWAVVAALAGGAVSVLLLREGGGQVDRTDGRPGRATASGAGTGPAPGSTPPVSTVRTPVSPPAPIGYRVVNDPMGFTLAVPDGFTRSHDGERIFYMSADGAFRIGIRFRGPVPGGPLAAMRRSDADGPDTYPGYRDSGVTATTHNGFPAALWEFTWNGFSRAEGERHTFDLCWGQDGRLYDVWVSAPLGRLDMARAHFDTALDSFVPPPAGVPLPSPVR
ncbi:serine/threonine-protein kinase [Streptomyces odonnellii]|uniref:serine/threonine-protein kinase n=1 Tax=Streptomyces odonnellii TaxID=1417980 RepID=UPI000626C55D|nr:serine/threonine-protein kinase [Streptomyces odonnellii]